VLVTGHRRQSKDLRLYGLLQIKHHAHHVFAILRHPHARDVGIIWANFSDPFFDRRVQFQAFYVDGQSGW
jgi:hypothetical protein